MVKILPNNTDSLSENKLDAFIIAKNGYKVNSVPQPSFMRSVKDILYEYVYMYFKLGSGTVPSGEVTYNYIDASRAARKTAANAADFSAPAGKLITSHELARIPLLPGKARIVGISDTHERHTSLVIPKCDVLIHCGDICFVSRKKSLVRTLIVLFLGYRDHACLLTMQHHLPSLTPSHLPLVTFYSITALQC